MYLPWLWPGIEKKVKYNSCSVQANTMANSFATAITQLFTVRMAAQAYERGLTNEPLSSQTAESSRDSMQQFECSSQLNAPHPLILCLFEATAHQIFIHVVGPSKKKNPQLWVWRCGALVPIGRFALWNVKADKPIAINLKAISGLPGRISCNLPSLPLSLPLPSLFLSPILRQKHSNLVSFKWQPSDEALASKERP